MLLIGKTNTFIDYFFLYETNKLSLTNNFKTNKK